MDEIVLEQLVHGDYEYAGFRYAIYEYPGGALKAYPHDDQHRAALKVKHRQAACEMFNQEYGWDKRQYVS